MYSQEDIYREQMLSRLQLWDGQLIHLRSSAQKLKGDARLRWNTRLLELEACNKNVFSRYADLLADDTRHWDEKRTALEAAADQMESKLRAFARQVH